MFRPRRRISAVILPLPFAYGTGECQELLGQQGHQGVQKLMASQAPLKNAHLRDIRGSTEVYSHIISNHNCQVYQDSQDCQNLQNHEICQNHQICQSCRSSRKRTINSCTPWCGRRGRAGIITVAVVRKDLVKEREKGMRTPA